MTVSENSKLNKMQVHLGQSITSPNMFEDTMSLTSDWDHTSNSMDSMSQDAHLVEKYI